MEERQIFAGILVLALLLALALAPSRAQEPALQGANAPQSTLGTAFTYQGELRKDGTPVDGPCDLQFSLWDAASGGSQVGSTLTRSNVTLNDGRFTVADLDFGAVFSGDARWLEVAVMCSSDSGYTTLDPRQALTAAPAALSLALPFSAQGSAPSPMVSIANSGSGDGVRVTSAGDRGITVGSAVHDGFHVTQAGSPSQVIPSDYYNNGVEVEGAEGYGVYVGSTGYSGVFVDSAGGSGLYVESAGGNGVGVWSADEDGVFVWSAGGDGVDVGSAVQDGVVVYSAGEDGLDVWSAALNGVKANTEQASGEWGFYTEDKVFAGSSLASGGSLMLVAQNGEDQDLEPGDLVAVSGMAAPFAGGDTPAPLVRKAGQANSTTAVGVVYRRLVAEEQVEEVEREGQVEQQTRLQANSGEGPVAPGDYLLIVALGPAQVKANAIAGGIRPGDLLAASAQEGQVRKAEPLTVSDVTFYPPGATIGKAMEPLDAAQGPGLIWVWVTLP